MRKPAARVFLAAVLSCLCLGTTVRADGINWSYNWTPNATEVFATNDPSLGKIILSNESTGFAEGDSYIVATNIKTASTATAALPAVFKDAGYHLTVTIFDGKLADSATFSGKFQGTLTANSALILNDFDGETTKSIQLGNHKYTINIGPFSPPGPPSANQEGSISALAQVTVTTGDPNPVPEPSSMALAGLGLSFAGGWWWKRRRAVRNSALALA